jgi:hypothetical protein
MAARVPKPAYTASPILYGDKKLYAKLGEIAEQDGGKELVEKFEIPIRSGKAWVVKKGWCLRGSRYIEGWKYLSGSRL